MKNVKRYFLSFLAALSIVLLAFGADKTFATTEETYDIVLTKVKMANLNDWPKQTGADGTEYTGQQLNIQNYFGAGSETYQAFGLKFTNMMTARRTKSVNLWQDKKEKLMQPVKLPLKIYQLASI